MDDAALAPNTVASLLRDSATRAATLEAIEMHEEAPIDCALSLAAAPALYELLAADSTHVGRDDFDRIGLMLGRLVAEGSDDPSAVHGAALSEGRYVAYCRSNGSVVGQALGKAASELTLADARSLACALSYFSPSFVRGVTKPVTAAGFPMTAEWLGLYMSESWFSK